MTNPTPDGALLWARERLALQNWFTPVFADALKAGHADYMCDELAEAFRAGQSHDAGLLAALEFYADPEMWTPHKNANSPIEMDDGKIARAAIAAAKGA